VLKQTPLNPLHRASGAKLVDFAGWEMPLHYGSQIEEHHRVRADAGMFDVSHMLAVDVNGEDARALLRYAVANNVDKLKTPGKALYGCLVNDAGGVIDDLIVYFLAEDAFRIVVNAGTADKDLAWLGALRETRGIRATLTALKTASILAVQGPRARDKVWRAFPGIVPQTQGLATFSAMQSQEFFVARTGYTGEDGFELIVPNAKAIDVWQALAAQDIAPIGLGARDTLRLEAGMNLYGQDMDEKVTPLESSLAWTVDLKSERDFVGKSALLAARVERQLVGLVLVDKGVLRAHQTVLTQRGEGEITSGGFSPTMNKSIALARIPAGVEKNEMVQVNVRDKPLAARVVAPPFVRHGKILIEEKT
jgi:aminomethyltransferase